MRVCRPLPSTASHRAALEYQELAVRERLGKGMPGEHALIVPSTVTSKDTTDDVAAAVVDESNLEQWAKFLFGGK